MKPAPFAYADPSTLDDALELLATHGDDATIIAGGQSLIPLLNLRLARPELLIDLRRVDGLRDIDVDSRRIRIGAMVTAAELQEHPSVDSVPGLAQALSLIGHSQIRARTTVGGSLAHADPAAELPALLLALDGQVTLCSRARDERVVAAADFVQGPLMTAREHDEVVTAVTFPVHSGSVVIDEVAPRPGDFAIVGAITAYDASSGAIADPRVVVFGVAGKPVRVHEAEAELAGATPSPSLFAGAGDQVRAHVPAAADIHGSAEYRRHLAAVLVERTLGRHRDR